VITNCFRSSAPFVNPSTHQVIHLYATSHKGPKFDKETGRVEELNHFDLLITPSKRQQLLFDGPSKQYWDLPVLQSEFVDSKRLEETYKKWSQVIYTGSHDWNLVHIRKINVKKMPHSGLKMKKKLRENPNTIVQLHLWINNTIVR
jgi:hypothetical protein